MKNFSQELAGFCMAYNKPFSEALARVYVASLQSYDESLCLRALNATAIELGRLPTPAEIIRKIDPSKFAKVTTRQDATIIAQQIINAVRKFGSSAKMEVLAEYLGEVGFAVVKNQWIYICNNMQIDDEKIWFAQFRDQADALINRYQAGTYSSMPCFPKTEVHGLINDLMGLKSL
jgi:putative transposon-encoded protein